jgi:hypothetical protein
MQVLTKALVGALVAVPLCGGVAAATPLSQSSALKSADNSVVEQVQFRHGYHGFRHGYHGYRGGRWIGPAAGLAAGLAIGGAIASSGYNGGYYAYGADPAYVAPGYAYGGVPDYITPHRTDSWIRSTPQYGSCTGDRSSDSGYPSWACR